MVQRSPSCRRVGNTRGEDRQRCTQDAAASPLRVVLCAVCGVTASRQSVTLCSQKPAALQAPSWILFTFLLPVVCSPLPFHYLPSSPAFTMNALAARKKGDKKPELTEEEKFTQQLAAEVRWHHMQRRGYRCRSTNVY